MLRVYPKWNKLLGTARCTDLSPGPQDAGSWQIEGFDECWLPWGVDPSTILFGIKQKVMVVKASPFLIFFVYLYGRLRCI